MHSPRLEPGGGGGVNISFYSGVRARCIPQRTCPLPLSQRRAAHSHIDRGKIKIHGKKKTLNGWGDIGYKPPLLSLFFLFFSSLFVFLLSYCFPMWSDRNIFSSLFVVLLSYCFPVWSDRNIFLVRFYLGKPSLSPQREDPLLSPQPANTGSIVRRFQFIARSSTVSTAHRLELF